MAAGGGSWKSGNFASANKQSAGGLRAGTYNERREVGQRYLDRLGNTDRALFSRAFGNSATPQSVDSLKYSGKKSYSAAAMTRLVKSGVVQKTADGRYQVTGRGRYALEARRTS